MKKQIIILVLVFIMLVIGIILLEEGTKQLFKEKYSDINEININADLVDIEFKKTFDKEVKVYIYGNKKDKLLINKEEDILNINKKSHRTFCLIDCYNKIIIYVPVDFAKVNINHEKGDIDFDVSVNEIIIKSKRAEIEIDNAKLININLDNGEIDIDKFISTGNSSIQTERANISIEKVKNTKVEIDINRKKSVMYKNEEYNLIINTRYGKVKVG